MRRGQHIIKVKLKGQKYGRNMQKGSLSSFSLKWFFLHISTLYLLAEWNFSTELVSFLLNHFAQYTLMFSPFLRIIYSNIRNFTQHNHLIPYTHTHTHTHNQMRTKWWAALDLALFKSFYTMKFNHIVRRKCLPQEIL